MTALAQYGAGAALVMGFGLLKITRVRTAAMLLAMQSFSVAGTAMVLGQPLMSIAPLLLAAGFWPLSRGLPGLQTHTTTIASIGAGAALAILCQSQGVLGLPSAIVLLATLLAATRPHRLMQIAALAAAQNGVALAGCLVAQPTTFPGTLLLPAACLVLPLPLATGLLVPALASPQHRFTSRLRIAWVRGASIWFGWLDLGLALAILVATLIAPIDPLALVFAPMLGLDGVLRSWTRRNRPAAGAMRRASALLQTAATVLAVCAPNPVIAWMAILAAMTISLVPIMSRRWTSAVLASVGAALALFGLVLHASTPSVVGYFSLFGGFVTIAAVVPELAVVMVILLLRLALQAPWPHGIQALGAGIAMMGLLGCAVMLTNRGRSHVRTVLVSGQASIAALSICVGHAEGRFAAMLLLLLLLLCQAAARVATGPVATLAIAGMGGLSPLGVFPGLVLVMLTISGTEPWLLLPAGAGLIPIVLASIPRRIPDDLTLAGIQPAGLVPLLLAVAAGYLAPFGLVHWWRIVAAGRP